MLTWAALAPRSRWATNTAKKSITTKDQLALVLLVLKLRNQATLVHPTALGRDNLTRVPPFKPKGVLMVIVPPDEMTMF